MAIDLKEAGSTRPLNVHEWMVDLRWHSAPHYWMDLICCATVFWTLVFIGNHSFFWLACALTIGSLSLYRMALFSHEISHLKAGVLPGFELAWNALCGVPLLLPSYMLKSHVSHHSTASYGTTADPEYLPFAAFPNLRIRFLWGSALVPMFFIVRSMVVVPSACLSSKVNRYLRARLTFMTMNSAYQPGPNQQLTKFDLVTEWATTLWAWTLFVATVAGWVPWHFMAILLSCMVIANLLNGWRTLHAHRYASQGQCMDIKCQLLDSNTFTMHWFWGELVCPVGQRFHAAHHLLPYLPYHALPQAHQRLISSDWKGRNDYLATFKSSQFL